MLVKLHSLLENGGFHCLVTLVGFCIVLLLSDTGLLTSLFLVAILKLWEYWHIDIHTHRENLIEAYSFLNF